MPLHRALLLLLICAPALPAQSFLGREVPDWVAQLDSKDPALRRSAAFALGKVGLEGATAVPKLTALLDDPDPAVAETAASALGELGSWSKPALPRLLSLLADPQ